MAHRFAIAVYFLLASIKTGQTTSYNSTTACFRGSEKNLLYSATCDRNTTDEVGLIAVNRVFYGAQPDAHLCQDTDTASECCNYTPNQDCFFANKPGQLPTDLVSGCSGQTDCYIAGKQKVTGSNCPLSSLFQHSSFTTYGFMEYQCINVGLLTDVCHDGILLNQPELYIDSNIYHTNIEHMNKSCSCKMTTTCGAAIIFEAVDIRLHKVSASECIEELHFVDNKESGVSKTVTCLDRDLNAFTEVFTSQSNSATLNLTIDGTHQGKLWIKVKPSWQNATVQVHCGATNQIDTHPDHLCPEDVPTTNTTTTTTTAPTTADVLGLPMGAVAGINVAGVIILLVIIFILVLVFRRKKKEDHIYASSSIIKNSYEGK